MTDANAPDEIVGRTYTLDEAARELRKRECAEHGHDWQIELTFGGPASILCSSCGWAGSVAMGARP